MLVLALLVLEAGMITVGAVVDGSFSLALAGLALFTLTAAWGLTPGRGGHYRGALPHHWPAPHHWPVPHPLRHRGGHRHA